MSDATAKGWYRSPFQTGTWCYDGPRPPPPMPKAADADMTPHAEIARLRADNDRLREALEATEAHYSALLGMHERGQAGWEYGMRRLDAARTRYDAARAALASGKPGRE